MPFEPIAIVGRSCVLPGALDPDALWRLVIEGRDEVGPAPAGRWRVRPQDVGPSAEEPAWSTAGGYVRGFEPGDDLQDLDPLFQWVLHGARTALREAGLLDREALLARGGLFLGNLSYPSEGMTRFGEAVWLERQAAIPRARALAFLDRPDARDRFMSGLPAHLAAAALGLGGPAFSLDAACASALYAIKLGVDALYDRRLDVAVAGAVNRADDLFLHVGFTALQALSRRGQSRPFHREADGLVPAEGAAFVVLRRLADAVRAGEPVFGVIRGLGLSNDGRGEGLLTPSADGQARALRAAYAGAGLDPGSVSLLECHATGTPVGDRTELQSVAAVWGDHPLALGSLKGNLGHLITAAGLAGLLKVLGAFQHRTLPPSRPVEPIDALVGGPLRLLQAPEPWESAGPRRAGINAFGFGGNNAHLLVEEPGAVEVGPSSWVLPEDPVAVVGLGVIAADAAGKDAFAAAFLGGRPGQGRTEEIAVPLTGLRSPPRDLALALGQQTALLAAAHEALAGVSGLVRERTAVLAGMGADAEVVRHGLRWRLATAAARWLGEEAPADWLGEAKAAARGPLTAAGVLGAMPNVVANRLNHQHDLAGPSFSVSSEEASGTRALSLAVRALRAGELDAVLVCAVDLASEPVHAEAAAALGLPGPPGDAAVALLLQRSKDAKALGNPVLATVEEGEGGELVLGAGVPGGSLTPRLGHAHAASGLLHAAAAVLATAHGARPAASAAREAGEPQPWLVNRGERRVAEVRVAALGGQRQVLRVASDGPARPLLRDRARLLLRFAGADRARALAALEAGRPGGDGPFRVVIAGADPGRREQLRARAVEALRRGELPWGEGVYAAEGPRSGDLAFLFTGAAGPYPGMGAALLTAFPEIAERLSQRLDDLPEAAWPDLGLERRRDPAGQMVASSFLAQVHAVFTRDVLGMEPAAALGYSLGESNALHALGAWDALTPMMREILDGDLFNAELAGEFRAVRRAWRRAGHPEADAPGPVWESWTLRAGRARVEEALTRFPLVRLMLVNAPDELVIGGFPAQVRALVQALGAPALPLDYPLAVHCPEVSEVEVAWLAYHRRPVRPVPVRFYSAASGASYEAETERAARALYGHAAGTLDFPRVVRRAWDDGVRVFVEHGPRALAGGWVRRILAEERPLVVSLDAPDRAGLIAVAEAVAQLWAAGVALREEAVEAWDARAESAVTAPVLRLPAHPPELVLPPLPELAAKAAPVLAPILEEPGERGEPQRRGGRGASARSDVGDRPTPAPRQELAPPSPHNPGHLPSAAATLLAGQAEVTEAHRQHLAAQSDAHQRYLALGAAAQAAMARGVARERAAALPGPKLSRQDLELISTGPISARLGPLFARQDGFARQVRMPAPPLLLCDRVLGIDAPPGELRPAVIWTETDVTWESWYLHQGRMPPGIMIEAGQADLLLVSWLGIDFLNQGERVYRLLGCSLSWHGPPPRPGETLRYEIHIDGFASHGDVRLFFFRYDCTVNGALRLRVRGGQAGFFTDQELDESEGVLWDPAESPPPDREVAEPRARCDKARLTRAELEAFSAGDLETAFGPAFRAAHAHVRTPTVAGGRMLLLDRVVALEPRGGPWGRGYLRAEQDLSPDAWFFAGHFHGDPCMPGTLMFEGCVQAMALYLASQGFTLDADGGRFQPVQDQTYAMRCRGQATPRSRRVTYELFVEELRGDSNPVLYADVLVSVDGLAAFHCRRLGLELVPDWPITSRPDWLAAVGRDPDAGLPVEPPDPPFGPFSVLSSAVGRPSDAFGAPYRVFDGARRAPRLPGPPYHLMTRVLHVDAPRGSLEVGATAEVACDVPPDAWYFAENHGLMPYAVLLEVALQPCGWLASWLGCALGEVDVFFRNLDGQGTLYGRVGPDAGELRTRTTLTRLSRLSGLTLVGFEVEVSAGGSVVLRLSTGFGFFPAESLARQDGLPATDADRAAIGAAGPEVFSLTRAPEPPSRWQRGRAGLPTGRLLMLDRVEGVGGGRAVGVLDVDPRAWFFKAHFFQDPVQPGSLGMEAMLQVLRFLALQQGLVSEGASLQPALGRPHAWRYRGQVRPHNHEVRVGVEITERAPGLVAGDASLWVDGLRIYEASGLALEALP